MKTTKTATKKATTRKDTKKTPVAKKPEVKTVPKTVKKPAKAKKATTTTFTKRVDFRMTEAQYKNLVKAAKKAKQPVSAYLRTKLFGGFRK